MNKVTMTFVEVEEISEVAPEPYHCYFWQKGYKDCPYWKAAVFDEDCNESGVGIADDAWGACKEALDWFWEEEE